ncbi:hypothetical protein ACF0H5_015336 [Mactra antiquata]
MDNDSQDSGLDDLRKKRLAYFQTPYNAETISSEKTVTYDNTPFSADFKSSTNAAGSIHAINGIDVKNVSHNTPVDSLQLSYSVDVNRNRDDSLSVPLRTSAFYFANPEKKTKRQESENHHKAKEESDGLDAYNETVERLIKATKEEILGQKASDDIWKKFIKDDIDDNMHSKSMPKDDDQNNSYSASATTKQSTWRNTSGEAADKREESNLVPKDDQNYSYSDFTNRKSKEFALGNSAADFPNKRGFESSAKQRDVNENLMTNARETLAKNTDYELTRAQIPSFSAYEPQPHFSSGEPSQRHHGEQKEAQKSYTTSKVEEIFSSRQITQSHVPRSVSFVESQEFEPIKEVSESVQQSLDLSELGLSTHRPESEREYNLKVAAEEMNLGDTVTKELRTVLGEEKFQEFLMKAKRDLADLHQDSSGRKDKTPRLIKDAQMKNKPETPKSKSDVSKSKSSEFEKPKSILKNSTNFQRSESVSSDKGQVTANSHTSDVKQKRSNSDSFSARSSIQDFTPRLNDGDAVENMIGEYVLNKPDNADKRDHSEPIPTEDSPVVVPKLDLAGVSKPDASRPKLNRPKNVPPTIYQDRQQEQDQNETDKEVKLSASKNYDQVTVPRNVAFSADEIYNQAYKGILGSQHQLNASNGHFQNFQNEPRHQGSWVPSSGTVPIMPMTPTTPVNHIQNPIAFDQSQKLSNFLNYSGNYGSHRDHYLRQSSHSSTVSDNIAIPHPPNQGGHTPQMNLNSAYPNYSDQRHYNVPMDPRHSVSVLGPQQPMFVPHPPTSNPSTSSSMLVSSSQTGPIGIPLSNAYQYPVVMMSPTATSGIEGQFFYPQPSMPPNMGPQVGQPSFMPPNMGSQMVQSSTMPPGFGSHIAHPGSMPPNVGIQMGQSHQMTNGGAQLYNSSQDSSMKNKQIEVKAEVHHPPATPSTSNVEVQTDREDSHEQLEKTTLVEESAFTSVSQLPDNDKFVPHPPSMKKAGPSPRRNHKTDTKFVQDSKRHIDGIRQHHEQRRKENEEEKLTEEQIIANQKRYAKASLDRYFSSLENVYKSSSNVQSSSLHHEAGLPEVVDENDDDNNDDADDGITENVEPVEDDNNERTVIEDVMSNVHNNAENFIEEENEKVGVRFNNEKMDTGTRKEMRVIDKYEEVHHNNASNQDTNTKHDANDLNTDEFFTDEGKKFYQDYNVVKDSIKQKFKDEVNVIEKSEVIEKDLDNDTVAESVVNTDVTLQGGGLTERLKDLGIDVSHSVNKGAAMNGKNKKNTKKKGDKKADKKGKVLIVCPECQGLNKQYMSWCTQCGEMIIGVEPMLVSKTRDGRIRTKPLNKDDDKENDEIRICDSLAVSKEINIDKRNVTVEVNYAQHVEEKPFVLNLETVKGDKDEEVLLSDTKKCSPIKSDGKDSGRPSSDDPDVDIQTQKIEEEVVNDICAAIADPVLKGYVKSHFNKSKGGDENVNVESQGKIPKNIVEKDEIEKVTNEFKPVKSYHDIVDMNLETKGLQNVNVDSSAIDNGINDNRDGWNDPKDIAQEIKNAQVNVSSKVEMFEKKDNASLKSKNSVTNETNGCRDKVIEKKSEPIKIHEPDFFEAPPPIPNFSSTVPLVHNELALKLPANSMDYSTDMSQAVSQSFNLPDEKGDNIEDRLRKEKEKAERKKERRRKKGHGAIDVEVFGYEESRESRNSSRANRMVPMLNLAGNSSDEDDSTSSNFKPYKPNQVQTGSKVAVKSSVNAWEPEVLEEDAEYERASPVLEESGDTYSNGEEKYVQSHDQSHVKPGASFHDNVFQGQAGINAATAERSMEAMVTSDVDESARLEPSTNQYNTQQPKDESWKVLFDPVPDQQQNEDEPVPNLEDVEDTVDESQPFLMQILNKTKPTRSKQRPKSAGGKPVKSKVRQSLEEPGYQRKWARSSTAWNSYNSGELNTSSSLRSSTDMLRSRASSLPRSNLAASGENKTPRQDFRTQHSMEEVRGSFDRSRRPVSAPKSRNISADVQASAHTDENMDFRASEQPRWDTSKTNRPASADVQRRKGTKKKSSKSRPFDNSIDLDLDMIEHRLPKPSMIERLNELMLSPQSTYDRLIEMTPRIQAGTVSKWQCLPDELLIHIFAYLDQTSLTKCAQVCQQFYRVAMDETLWKYITIKKNDIDDSCLGEIAKRHPVSLALIQCHGEQVTAKGLRDLFKDCANTLKELNVARCSGGALNGDSLMLHAAARCHNLTHIDASWCALTDSGLMAISNCCQRIESLCINGCNAITNDGLETTIKKHGTSLRVLEMFGCFNLSPRGLRSVSTTCINLISLNLGQCYKVTDSCISQLSTSLGKVETLDLRGCKQIKDNCMRRIVKNCPRLKNLSIANCPSITDVSILEISTYLTDIRSLDVCGCKNITDGSIRALVNTCTNLRHIDISSTSCTHRSVSMIANFSGQRLETLKINFLSDVTEQSLIKLAKHCRRLKSVHLYGCTSTRNLSKVRDERPNFTIEM